MTGFLVLYYICVLYCVFLEYRGILVVLTLFKLPARDAFIVCNGGHLYTFCCHVFQPTKHVMNQHVVSVLRMGLEDHDLGLFNIVLFRLELV